MPRPQPIEGGEYAYRGTGRTGRIRTTEGPFERRQDRNKPQPLTEEEYIEIVGLLRQINDLIRRKADISNPDEYESVEASLSSYLHRMKPEEIAAIEEAIRQSDSAITPSQEKPYGWNSAMGSSPWTKEPYAS